MYWDQPAAPHLIENPQPNWIQQGNVGRSNRSGLPEEDWEREEEGSPENQFKKIFVVWLGCSVFCFFFAI
jgi:hypothetical protein